MSSRLDRSRLPETGTFRFPRRGGRGGQRALASRFKGRMRRGAGDDAPGHLRCRDRTHSHPGDGEGAEGWPSRARAGRTHRSASSTRGKPSSSMAGSGEFLPQGHAVSTCASPAVAGGILPGADGWLQLPCHRLRYDEFRADRPLPGTGDTKLSLRIAPLRYLASSLPLSIRAGRRSASGTRRGFRTHTAQRQADRPGNDR